MSTLEENLTKTPFQLFDSDLFYFALIKLPGETALFFKTHHLITDGWAMTIIMDKTLEYYLALKNKQKLIINTSPYLEYIKAEQKYFTSERFNKDQAFWNNQIQSIPEFVYLKNKPANCSTKMKRNGYYISTLLSSKINHFCNEQKISIFILFTSAFIIYIHYIYSKRDVALGTALLNRTNNNEKMTIGLFINVVPFRVLTNPLFDYISFIQYLNGNWRNVLKSQKYPHDFVIEKYREVQRTISDIYDVTISYHNAIFKQKDNFKDFKSQWHSPGYQINSLNIHISNRDESENYLINYDYLIDVFSESEITQLNNHFLKIIENALNEPLKKINEIELLTIHEKSKIMYDYNNQPSYLSLYQVLHQYFEVQVKKTPEKVALIYDKDTMTYDELNKRANQLAFFLRKKGITRNNIVGLMVKRSFEMFIGIIGILKAGGAYLPLDPDYPKERLKYILENSNCNIILKDNPLLQGNYCSEIIDINSIDIQRENSNDPVIINEPQDLAYVIYTSGSTGNPKGVLIEHKSIINTLIWRINHYLFNSKDVLLQIPTFCFDSSVEDIFSFLIIGASLVIINQEQRYDLIHIKKLIMNQQITHFLISPAFYNTMLDTEPINFPSLKNVTIAGESFHIGLVKKHFKKLPHVRLYNEYGPTENSVCSTVYQFSPEDEEVLIGKPICNCHCYVLNHEQKLQPIDTAGELYLAGPGLARGYLNNSDYTAEKFINNPQIGQRLYKTGDIVKWTPEGNLKFIERIDNQVKIRGFRVELDEIKNTILLFKDIKNAVVITSEGINNISIIHAYLVANSWFDLSELKKFLHLHLPQYMIPSCFHLIDHLPLTLNGKVDKTKLPDIIEPEKTIVLPETNIEKELINIWKEIFKIDIGINNDLFEFGLDSLGIIQILTVLYNRDWNLSVPDFYKYRTIRELASYICSTLEIKQSKNQIRIIDIKKPHFTFLRKEKLNLSFNNSNKNIFLTGVTGFLGVHLLYNMLKTTEAEIYCLIRDNDDRDAQNRFKKIIHFYFHNEIDLFRKRVHIVRGDINRERIGLSEQTYSKLFRLIDTVIHSAALVKHYGEYNDFEKTNIQAVQEIINFCKNNKQLFYISTTSVSGNYANITNNKLHFTEDQFDIGQDFSDNYYVKSKFTAEKLIRKEITNGLKASIIRVGNLTGRYNDGQFQINISDNKFYNILKSIITLQAIPKSLLSKKLEFTPVDICSQAIIKLILTKESIGKTFHLLNDNYLTFKVFLKILSKYKFNIKPLPDDIFYKYLKQVSYDSSKRHILMGLITDLQNGQLNYHTSIIIDSEFSKAYLHLLNFYWPKIDENYIQKIIYYMIKNKFIIIPQQFKNTRHIISNVQVQY